GAAAHGDRSRALMHLPPEERLRDVQKLDDPRLPALVVLAKSDPQTGPAVGIRCVSLVGDRRPVQDVAADPGHRVLGHLPIRKPGLASALPFADEEREDVELARGARAPLAVDGLRRIGHGRHLLRSRVAGDNERSHDEPRHDPAIVRTKHALTSPHLRTARCFIAHAYASSNMPNSLRTASPNSKDWRSAVMTAPTYVDPLTSRSPFDIDATTAWTLRTAWRPFAVTWKNRLARPPRSAVGSPIHEDTRPLSSRRCNVTYTAPNDTARPVRVLISSRIVIPYA